MKIKIDRMFIDKILGMTETRAEMEAKIVKALEFKNYPKNATSRDFRVIRNISFLILGRDMHIIELSGKEAQKTTNPKKDSGLNKC